MRRKVSLKKYILIRHTSKGVFMCSEATNHFQDDCWLLLYRSAKAPRESAAFAHYVGNVWCVSAMFDARRQRLKRAFVHYVGNVWYVCVSHGASRYRYIIGSEVTYFFATGLSKCRKVHVSKVRTFRCGVGSPSEHAPPHRCLCFSLIPVCIP